MSILLDDPSKNFRQRYKLPDQFIWDVYDLPRIDFDGYMKVVLDLLPPPPISILDAGCGPGLGSQLLKEKGYTVTGVDYNERGIGFAQLLVPGCKFMQLDVRLLDQAEDLHHQFDATVNVEVIEHIPPVYHDTVLAGLCLVLRTGGTLVLTVPSTNMPMNRWHYKHFTETEVVHLVERSGFVVKNVVYQHQMSWLMSSQLQRLLRNRVYELRILRYLLRQMFFVGFNTTNKSSKAGRLVVQAEKRGI